jgi:hypothetical protein
LASTPGRDASFISDPDSSKGLPAILFGLILMKLLV